MTKTRKLFDVLNDGGSGLAGGTPRLSERELGLLVGALNYQSLIHCGREFKAIVLRGPEREFPRLTGYACHRHEWESDRAVVCTVTVKSNFPSTSDGGSGVIPLVIDLGGEGAEGGASYYDRPGRKAKLLRRARFGAPIAWDALRQGLTDYHEKHLTPNRRPPRLSPIMATTQPGTPPEEGEKAIIFGLHWLEMGGAEKWALETIALARSAGFLPIVLTDRESSHPWITRPELDGALVIPMNPPMSDDEETAFLLGLLEKFSVRGIHVHHNGWLYHRLPWFKAMNPAIHTVDSLHVVEWRTGGFVELAVKLSNAIDTHHVISPQLRDYMVLQRDVPKNRVELAPLYGLSSSEPVLNIEKDSERPFTISFIGRLSQQKRPYLFLRYAAALKRSVNQEVRFILHGTGALADETSRLIAKYGLTAHLDWRQPPRSVDETLAQSDLLVISSDNEGLTLTTFEATAHDVAVLSTDVGSQASLVSGEALVPRQTLTFLKEAVERTKAIIASEDLRNRIVEEQRQKIAALRELPEARDWTAKLYEGWKA
ncbi:glycosyltransferase [Pseudarthrobacter phenanthrenivorans]|uniref:Glycosyltransferase n=2 Tax=Pseudarthrobacter phenanthrenivorans TaxID=361575 RepID=A0A3B0G4L3_PSEPS|nr:glycosyltransferase [Pseudarthrobacter phenanthrenivorans]